MINDNNNPNYTLSPTGTKNLKDPPQNAEDINNNSTDAKNTDYNSTSTSSDNKIKHDGTEKATNMGTDTATTIKDNDQKQSGGTKSPT